MVDLAKSWPLPEQDWPVRSITGDLAIRPVCNRLQTLVSGDLDIWRFDTGIELGRVPVDGQDYALRVGRDRALAVTARLPTHYGWNAAGYATTDVSGGYVLLEFSGDGLPGLLARATTLPTLSGQSVARHFAGMPAIAYCMDSERLRLHVDRSLSAYLWSWLKATDTASSSWTEYPS